MSPAATEPGRAVREPDPAADPADPADPAGHRGVGRAAVAVLLVAALAVGALAGSLLTRSPALAAPAEGSVEAGFARDMQVHHAQAVQLAVLVRDRSTDPEVRTVALDILLTQQNQIGQMAGWLATWGLPAAGPGQPMAWMTNGSHAHPSPAAEDGGVGYAAMPGWVTGEDIARLTAADGTEADRLFLQLMIPHHEGGVTMAAETAERAQNRAVIDLARGVVTAQERELTVLRDLLADRGGPVA